MKVTDEMLYNSALKAAILWLDLLPSDNQIPKHTFSHRFKLKMKRLVQKQNRSPFTNQFVVVAKKIAIVILISAIISFTGLMSVKAYRAKFIEVITEIFDSLTHFSFFSSWNNDSELGKIVFSYLPNNITETGREVFDEPKCQIIYLENADGYQLKLTQQVLTDAIDMDLIIDTEDADTKNIYIGDSKAFLVVKNNMSTLIWEKHPFLLLLSGDFSSDEIIKIANNIYFQN